MIFDIQRCSIHDGAGLRTLVFFKGCPLRCLWCANPESQSYEEEIMETPIKCIGCERCVKICTKKAISLTENGYKIRREKCAHCYKCIDNCFSGAKRLTGIEYEVDELYKEINKDRIFYSMYGGGVTFSGGEPLTQPAYLAQIAEKCKKGGFNVAIESCGFGDFEKFKVVLPYIDYVFFDIKHIDSEAHKEITGAGNELILENLKHIADAGIPMTVRTPIVPGYTDTVENVVGIAQLIKKILSVEGYELLKYHELGKSKYKALNREYPMQGIKPPSDDEMKALVKASNEVFTGTNKKCFVVVNNNQEDYYVNVEKNGKT